MKSKEAEKQTEVVIPKGYSIEEILDTDDDDFGEEPILTREARIRFE